jgi:hypothetical protein
VKHLIRLVVAVRRFTSSVTISGERVAIYSTVCYRWRVTDWTRRRSADGGAAGIRFEVQAAERRIRPL